MPGGRAYDRWVTAAPVPLEPSGRSVTVDAPRRRRGRGLLVLVAILVVVAVLVVVAELVARQVVPGMIRTAVAEQLALPAEHPIDVEVDGILLPQLLTGALDQVRIASRDVAVGPVGGDVRVEARGVPIRGDAPAEGATAEVRMTPEQLRTLLATIDGFPAETVGLAAPNVTASGEFEVLGATIPVGVAFAPSVAEGDLVLTPAEGTIGEASVTADQLRGQLFGLLDPLLEDRRVCIAEHLPAALTLQSIEVAGDELVAGFDIDGGILADPALREPGTC